MNKILHFTPLEKKNVDEKKLPNINRSSFFDSLTGFIKYNNATVIILAIILILGGGAFAAGPEAIGQRETSVQGLDNTALLAADLAAFNMDFKIEKIEQDEKYYYATYSFLDLAERDSAWQYELSQRTQKVSKKIKEDIGVYLAKFLAKHYEARVRELTQEKILAEAQGQQKRIEVTEYSGLIGLTLDLAAAVFPGYEPVVKRELPEPNDFNLPVLTDNSADAPVSSSADNLTRIYNEYVAAHPEIFSALPDGQAGSSTPPDLIDSLPVETDPASGLTASSTPPDSTDSSSVPADPTVEPTPNSIETPVDSAGSPQVIPEPNSVEIIDLPTGQADSSVPAPETAPAPVVEQ